MSDVKTLEELCGQVPELGNLLVSNIRAALEELDEDRRFCLCGCPISEHENYGEDGGESCGDGDHVCLRVCAAGASEYRRVLEENEQLRTQALSMTVYAQSQEARIGAARARVSAWRHSDETLGEHTAVLDDIFKALRGEK